MARVNEESHSFTCHPHVGLNHNVFPFQPQIVTALWPVLIFRPAEGRRLSWPEWLVSNRDVLSASGRSPIPVLTGPGVE